MESQVRGRNHVLDHEQVALMAPAREGRIIAARYYALLIIGGGLLAFLV